MTEITVPELSLVALVGVSGSGKSTFAARHFLPTEVLSSDFCRGLVADDPNDQSVSGDAFEVLHYIAGKRLAASRLTVVDATNVQSRPRQQLVELARAHDVLPVAIVLDVPESLALERNASRPDRDFGPHVVRRQRGELRRSLRSLEREGFRRVIVLRSADEIDSAVVVRQKLWNDKRDLHGPFDIVGDIHGCRAELEQLLTTLGYAVTGDPDGGPVGAMHPEGRTAVFVGDLVDRGPDTPGVLRLVMGMVRDGTALCVPGNHENKLLRALRGRNVQLTHGLPESLEQLADETAEFREEVCEFVDGLVSHFVLDGGRLVVAHAGLTERYQGRASGRVRSFALYGETTGETDEVGLPVRYDWAADYRGSAAVVYGHTPVPDPEWVNNTICVDTGCVFGGRLTALRWPERALVSVPAARVYYQPAKPFPSSAPPVADRPVDLLDVADVLHKRIVETRHHGRVTVREENAAAALEVMSRFAMDPRWLVYLPPTMSPVATSSLPDLLEHPAEAFSAYRADGVGRVVCEEKHMGSRCVVVVCRDETVAARRFFGAAGLGAVYTRTGRPFFPSDLSVELLSRISAAVTAAGLWDELSTDWLALDCELMPWSAKALDLLRTQYAAVGAAARGSLPAAVASLSTAVSRGVDLGELLAATEAREANAASFVDAYRRYCWPTDGLSGVRLAPFQLLATEGQVYADRDHHWHLAVAARLVAADGGLFAETQHVDVDVTDPASEEAAVAWWEQLTAAGGEGMVVKPLDGLVRGRRGLVQPGLKVRGREYLRIIYGPDYTLPQHLTRLRQRGLGHKRSLATREYALGIEALDRTARAEPLWRVHECVFAVLALESEPVDPRL
jgi:protein phosphatase